MRKSDLIKAWKNPELREHTTPESPIGQAMDKNQEELLKGGLDSPFIESEGWVCGISGEVTGFCCNPFTSWG